MQKFDYIITGSGASGLLLAYQLSQDSFFDSKQILILDREEKTTNDKTWCFWEKENGIWDTIVYKKWETIFFGSPSFSKSIHIAPYVYKMIRSSDFYRFVLGSLEHKNNFTLQKAHITAIKDNNDLVEVQTDTHNYIGSKVFNSALRSESYVHQKKYPVLNQHFIGWFIKTPKAVFNDGMATFMDFNVDQNGNTRFMYVLPVSSTEALFEYTLFSEDLLEKENYENAIISYLKAQHITDYQITEKEHGCIPMTCYPFEKQNTKNILNIGTAGGWTKPSTGYTFSISASKTKALKEYLKKNEDLSKFQSKSRFWYYDLIFLDVLYHKNHLGAALFSTLFRKNKIHTILSFLDEKTSIIQELKIMASFPSANFIKMILKRLFS